MQEHRYFQEALSDFTQETANGGAIRHLADLGYTVRRIMETLDFPASYERVQRAVWEHLVRTGVILLEEPGGGRGTAQEEGAAQWESAARKKRTYVREYDQYGKTSFRLVEEEETAAEAIHWKERRLENGAGSAGKRLEILREKLRENGVDNSYMSCDFGLDAVRNPERLERMLKALHESQREYLAGLPWERRRVYHRLDSRMREVLFRLCEKGLYQGECFFSGTKDKICL